MADAKQSELKPCPRCGGQAFVTLENGVWCRLDRCLSLPPRASREEAVTAWNHRHGTDAGNPLVDALQLFAQLEIPKKPDGNAGFYSIPFSRIEKARAALAEVQS